MGIISDYLEQCRARSDVFDIDPNMYIGGKYSHFSSYYDIQTALNEFLCTDKNDQKELLRQRLATKTAKLESIKTGYLISEKIVLRVKNTCDLQSAFVIDTVELLLSELNKSYHAICKIQQSISMELKSNRINEYEQPDEGTLRKQMLDLIVSSTLTQLKESAPATETSTIRKTIMDMAQIIKCLEQEQYHQPAKKIVQYYLENKVGLTTSHTSCVNCGKPLLVDFPYCLNCYERN